MSSIPHEPLVYPFRTFFESAPDPYLVLSADLFIVAVTDAYLRATLTTREQIIGKHIFIAFPDNPDDPAASGVDNLRASLLRVLQSGAADAMAVQKYSIRRPGSEGGFDVRYWSPLNTPVFDDRGDLAYIIHRVEDVTEFVRLKENQLEQYRLTEELRSKTEQMEHDIFQRGQQLQLSNDRLREAERAKNEFFANISHELRTPLSLILAPTESLLSGTFGGCQPAQRSLLQTIHNNAVRLLQMVTGMLDLVKAEAGKMIARPEPIDAKALVVSVTHEFMPVARQKGLDLSVNPIAEPAGFLIDRYLFERILFNLLSNAIKFTDTGGQVMVNLSKQKNKLQLTVVDTGIGIAPENLRLLFRKFSQIEGSSTRRFEGTGLGLAMVREFSELMGGNVSVKSEPGKGCTFTVEIPAVETTLSIPAFEQPAPVHANSTQVLHATTTQVF